jgi:hypothetical protein
MANFKSSADSSLWKDAEWTVNGDWEVFTCDPSGRRTSKRSIGVLLTLNLSKSWKPAGSKRGQLERTVFFTTTKSASFGDDDKLIHFALKTSNWQEEMTKVPNYSEAVTALFSVADSNSWGSKSVSKCFLHSRWFQVV